MDGSSAAFHMRSEATDIFSDSTMLTLTIVRVCAKPVSPVMTLPELFSVSTPLLLPLTSPRHPS